jgi:hypothetical protein
VGGFQGFSGDEKSSYSGNGGAMVADCNKGGGSVWSAKGALVGVYI